MGTSMLFFAGNAKLKPFVPSERKPLLTKEIGDKPHMSESLMTSADAKQFDFLKDADDAKEW
jgi:hypothetical protein